MDFPSSSFDETVAAVCHGTAGETELRALNELLRRDNRARDEYLLRVELHVRLGSDPELFASAAAETSPGQSAVSNLDDRWPVPALVPAAAGRGNRTRRVLAVAAGLALVALAAWSVWLRPPRSKTGATSSAVAMLVRTVDAHWGEGGPSLRSGSPLPPGRLQLEAGLAQVVFYGGARIVIQGPAELWIVSVAEAALRTGRLLAEIPSPARGFRLRTEQCEVVDLGSGFGIVATPDQSEVHVFDGKVELLAPAGAKWLLNKGQAGVVPAGHAVRSAEARRTAFATLFEFQERSLAAQAFRYEQWQFANAPLDPDPARLVHLAFQEFDRTTGTPDDWLLAGRSAAAATVVGCERVQGRWREKPALEFRSVNDRVRLKVPGEFDALTVSAWVCIKGLDRQFNSLFMCDGFEPGTIHWLIRRDGALGLTVFGHEPGQFQILASPPVLTLDQLGLWTHLAVVLDGPGGRGVHYLDGAPVSEHALRVAPPFRIGPSELGNWNGGSTAPSHPTLIRNLSGAIDEFELLGRALSDAEIRELYVKGNPNL